VRIYVLTQEDSFYLPRILDHLLAARDDVVGIGVVPGELRTRHAIRYLQLMGWRDFLLQSLRLAAYKIADLASRVLPLARSFSIRGAARRGGVSCEPVPDVNAPPFVDRLRVLGVDLVVSLSCPQVFKRALLTVPRYGCINLHGALLPRLRGLLPSFWALALGDTETGVTVHYMEDNIDGGDVILQERIRIRADDTVHSIVERGKVEVGRFLLVEAIERIAAGDAPRGQVDITQGSYFSYPGPAAIAEFRSRGRRFI
jgi:methionyl-tRNA formyltransferase